MTRRAAARAAPARRIDRSIIETPLTVGSEWPRPLRPKTPQPSPVFRGWSVPVRSSPIDGYSCVRLTGHDACMHHPVRRLAFALATLLIVSSAATLATAGVAAAADFPASDSRYHTYAEMLAEIQATRDAHPDIVAIKSIGKSHQGRDLWVAKVSDNVATDEPEPEVMLDSLHHAREQDRK